MKRLVYILTALLILGAMDAWLVRAEDSKPQAIAGIVRNQAGTPLVGAVISIFHENWVDKAVASVKSQRDGSFDLGSLTPGRYVINVVKSGYKPFTEILMAPVTRSPLYIVMKNMVAGEGEEDNWDLKTVLRTSRDRNLIFRAKDKSGSETDTGRVLKEGNNLSTTRSGLVQFTTNQSLGAGGYSVLPGPIGTGFSTRFAYVEPLGTNTSYVVTGMITTGMDSQYRIRNLLNYQVDAQHKIQLKIGYDKMGSKRRAIHEVGDVTPDFLENEILHTIEPIQNINVGIQDMFQISEPLAIVYGFDINYNDAGRGTTLINPRFQLYFTPTDNLGFRFQLNNERQTHYNTLKLPEGETVHLDNPFNVAKINNQTFLSQRRHMETGLSYFFNSKTSLEVSAFLDEVTGLGQPFVAILKSPDGNSTRYPMIPDAMNDSKGFRFNLTQRWTSSISTSVVYIYGSGTDLATNSTQKSLDLDLASSFRQRFFNIFSTTLDAKIHSTGTDLAAVYRRSEHNSLTPVDSFSDYYDLGNNSLSVFVRQNIPLFQSSIGKWEAILDIRNILNQGVEVFETPSGDLILVRSPRSFRGGISFRF